MQKGFLNLKEGVPSRPLDHPPEHPQEAAFVPMTEAERREMLGVIGVRSVEELLKGVPRNLLYPELKVPPALTEMELMAHLKEVGGKNMTPICFMGGGAYERYIPAAVWPLALRGEFATAYTPYQAEASQGTLQAIYEFQSMVAELYGMDVANASLYDGGSAMAEAVHAALRHTGRHRVVLARSVHPHYRQTVRSYFGGHRKAVLDELPCPAGTLDDLHLRAGVNGETACVVIQSPNFFGLIEDVERAAAVAHERGALAIVATDPVALGLLRSPGEMGADIAVGEGQGLGLPLSYGGPSLGLYACRKELVRSVPGRLCGRTLDVAGQPGFVLTLQAREQHIRRQRASSNVCTNQALCALAATIHLALLGPQGLKEVCELSYRNAHLLAEGLANAPGLHLRFQGPFLHEFVVEIAGNPQALQSKLLREGFLVGPPLGRWYPEHRNALLVAATETRKEDEVRRLAERMRGLA